MPVSKELGDLIDQLMPLNAELAHMGREERLEARMREGKLIVNVVVTAPIEQDVDVDEFMARARAAAKA
jgi:hypothetical protein